MFYNHFMVAAKMKDRLDSLVNTLTHQTLLEQWFRPLQTALDKVRYREKIFNTLTMPTFLLLGCLRQLQSQNSLREQIQSLMHHDNSAIPPLARSTWSDALASKNRCRVTRDAFSHLTDHARSVLPDRLAGIKNLGEREVIAIDASYQTESSHYAPCYPKQGGTDNQKGHMLMTFYDLRKGIPLDVKTETASRGEMRVIKENIEQSHWMEIKNALYSVDRAFIDARYWDERKKKYQATMITRFKSLLVYTTIKTRMIANHRCNEGVLSDTEITLKRSKQCWRRIEFKTPQGERYAYLTNDFSLEPGELAFIYHRRWDEEKFFDNFKNDLANSKAWGKNPISIEQQTLLGIMTYLLTRLFLEQKYQELSLKKGNITQSNKHRQKIIQYKQSEALYLRAYWTQLSKIPLQVWRFLKNCFMKKASPQLYERQLKPILTDYL